MASVKGKALKVERAATSSKHLPWVDAKIYVGGHLEIVNQSTIDYVGGEIYLRSDLDVGKFNYNFMLGLVKEVMDEALEGVEHENFSIWYPPKSSNLKSMKLKAENESDVKKILDGRDEYNRVCLFAVIERKIPNFFPTSKYRCKNFHYPTAAQLNYKPTPIYRAKMPNLLPLNNPTSVAQPSTSQKPKPQIKQQLTPVRRSPRHALISHVQPIQSVPNKPTEHDTVREDPLPEVIPCGPNWTEPEHNSPPLSPATTKAILAAENPRAKFYTGPRKKASKKPKKQPFKPPRVQQPISKHNLRSHKIEPITKDVEPDTIQSPPVKKTPPRIKHVVRKPKPKGKKTEVRERASSKRKEKTVIFYSGDSDNSFEGGFSEESSNCDTDLDFDPEEEDREDSEAREQELEIGSFGAVKQDTRNDGADADVVDAQKEIYYDSDELRSVHGSDDENEDHHPTFNPSIDLKGQVVLKQGLKFTDINVLRRALNTHAIQNHYDYYLLHNNSYKLTTYCRYRCGCPWDSQHGIIEKCVCKGKYRCNFRVYALRMKGSTDLQIKTCKLEHECGYQDVNSKATSKFLAEDYLDLWRADPCLGLKSFVNIVQRELGLKIGYQKAWMARARAKLMIYGDAAEEYGKVFDYGHALLKYNPGSTVIITTEGQETCTPVFQRMYVCLAACKAGFLGGCRPLVGVDGCHLKGAYPGMLLVAVSKDGNNMIYPLAWAVVEVENTKTWTWFLSLLVDDINKPDGEELTIMSDRQKGLLEAISECLPKAEVRYCVRHIWANFKLQFTGQAFKEYFWHAARTCNVNVFNGQMQIIKMLNEEAFQWLEAIPAEHWARHKFQNFSKTNMLLNNLCETFNGVLRGARDKPIISCMEWVRKYVMRRNFEKLTSLEKVKGRFMPYVGQVLKWVSAEASNCFPVQSSLYEWEVSHNGDDLVVNLREWTCDCKKWVLTGIPCPHAFACILKRRENPENYVHHYYSKEMYNETYKHNAKPMPGMKHWEVQNLDKPSPPPFRKLPGRPSQKKRKKSAGEDEPERFVLRPKRQNNCSKCGQPGHNRTKCQNVLSQSQPSNRGGRPYSNDPWVVNQRNKKKAKAEAVQKALNGQKPPSKSRTTQTMSKTAPVASQASQNNPKAAPKLTRTTREVGECSKAAAAREKLQVKPVKKKLISDLLHE